MFKVTCFYKKSYPYAKRFFLQFYYFDNAISTCFSLPSIIEKVTVKKDGKLIARTATYTGV